MRRTKEQAARTRADILAAAHNLFAEKGFEHTSLEAVAEAAGVTRGAVYWYFANKAAILDAILERECAPIEDLVSAISDESIDAPLQALARVTSETFGRIERDDHKRCIYAIFRQMSGPGVDGARQGPDLSGHARQFRRQLETVFAYAQRLGQLNPSWTPELAALGFNAMVTGMLEEWSQEAGAFDIGARGARVVALFLDHLGATD
ncbi:TetR family transcriptional regulator (plasmid) [Paroceanicella profunda]|uniref:TetR family transcriptional regulator n=1 Tax=Paroceanicella profunda TaxID=2579971 RepID=A0A5B8G4T4_9RHOB|nr:TetR family transcriptional regulator [Paroceanicella profunda]QDL94469.1 TetR family transcriptional regulator [Paroceanicella profunda]